MQEQQLLVLRLSALLAHQLLLRLAEDGLSRDPVLRLLANGVLDVLQLQRDALRFTQQKRVECVEFAPKSLVPTAGTAVVAPYARITPMSHTLPAAEEERLSKRFAKEEKAAVKRGGASGSRNSLSRLRSRSADRSRSAGQLPNPGSAARSDASRANGRSSDKNGNHYRGNTSRAAAAGAAPADRNAQRSDENPKPSGRSGQPLRRY